MKEAIQTLLPSARYPGFLLKTMRCLASPSGYGYYKELRKQRLADYDHETQKHPVREKHHGEGGWSSESEDGIRGRDYESYDEYLDHQKQKYDEILKMNGGFSGRMILSYRLKFFRRFRRLPALLPSSATALCAGARQGTEVEVLRDLGFQNAWGIDLNPGVDNPWVKPGDFMNLDHEDSSVDFFYTNCVDHAFDLDAFFKEHSRVLKPEGYAIYDIATNMESDDGGAGAFEAVEWSRTEDIVMKILQNFGDLVHVERENDWMWVMVRGRQRVATSQAE